MTKKNLMTSAFAAGAMMIAGAGCHSHPAPPSDEAQSADLIEHNRLLINLALAENVHNGVAAERAVYPRDFNAGTAALAELGARRVAMLAHACRDGNCRITVVRGEESDALYDKRVAVVRQGLADAGLNLADITVSKGGAVGGEGSAGACAILTYNRMLSDYTPRHTSGGGAGSGSPQPGAPTGSNFGGDTTK